MVAATHHDRHAADDFRALARLGIRAVRDGLRWHLIERSPGRYDWRSFLPMLRAARSTGTQVIWDLCHYGWPDDLDIWGSDFPGRFARLARAAARVIADETDAVPFFCPINEISFWSWAGGDAAYLSPFAHGRGFELKVQLARAAIEAMDAIWEIDPRARMVHAEPIIHIVADPDRPHDIGAAEGQRQAQYQCWDLLSGRLWPQIGGEPRFVDILGVNFYHNNQWVHGGPPMEMAHPLYRPLSDMLEEVYRRYERPVFIAETGIEGERRPLWLRYVGEQARAAMRAGVPLEGICWYPIVNHPGWDDDRHCPNGLLDTFDVETGERAAFEPLADELRRQQGLFAPPVPSRSAAFAEWVPA